MVGPLPCSSSGYYYILSVFDCVSKFVHLFHIPSTPTVATVTQLIEDEVYVILEALTKLWLIMEFSSEVTYSTSKSKNITFKPVLPLIIVHETATYGFVIEINFEEDNIQNHNSVLQQLFNDVSNQLRVAYERTLSFLVRLKFKKLSLFGHIN